MRKVWQTSTKDKRIEWYTQGIAFDYPDSGKCYRDFEISQTLSHCKSFADFADRCAHLDGQWRIFVRPLHDPTLLYVAVDPLSSFRIYYRKTSRGDILFSDNGFDFISSAFTPLPETELFFSRWGFLQGTNTLHHDVFFVEPATALRIDDKGNISTLNYLGYPQTENPHLWDREEDAWQAMDEAFDKARNKLLTALDSRPVLLPLTAGRDSRLIATWLKRSGYKNVHTFTYGVNKEIEENRKAREIALRLGFSHEFIPTIPPYMGEHGYTQSSKIIPFLKYVSGASSGYYFQEYQAAGILSQPWKERGAVVLPGHVVDMLFGSCITDKTFLRTSIYSLEQICRSILWRGSGNRQLSKKEWQALMKITEKQIELSLHQEDVIDPVALFQFYILRHQEARYFLNSIHSWRYFDLPVWLPFANRDVIHLGLRLPKHHLVGAKLYGKYCEREFQKAGVSFGSDNSLYQTISSPISILKSLLRPYLYRWLMSRNQIPERDDMGLVEVMQPIIRQIKQNSPYKATTINGVSFAWMLQEIRDSNSIFWKV